MAACRLWAFYLVQPNPSRPGRVQGRGDVAVAQAVTPEGMVSLKFAVHVEPTCAARCCQRGRPTRCRSPTRPVRIERRVVVAHISRPVGPSAQWGSAVRS
jgi:hypothetical protein